ncbi:DUF1127 domain-containing protein [Mesorhizobium sp. SP-1A]|uniref:DUF1127 domain-containing protein n=1 Tax=Mesorhizobium sp. SP-1A TaxID=3077840 RepID=UPI0028F72683|nr:DUF1127 domain-containing protein [Mesorhizobium sp. SP-1A]
MSTYDFASQASRITTRPAAAVRVFAVASGLYRTWRNRHAFYRLTEMSDAELADMGLTRADMRAASALPFAADPTVKLCALVSERAKMIEAAARKVA